MLRGARASVTLDHINLSLEETGGSRTRIGRGSVALVGNQRASYAQIYRTQIWPNAIVNKLSRGIGRLPLKVYSRAGAERERVRTGGLYDLLESPYEGCSPFHFKSAVIGNMAIYGNAVAVKGPTDRRPGTPPTELIVSDFSFWEVLPGKERPVDWYVFRGEGGQVIPFRPEEVVHWRWWGPGSDTVGPSPLEALRTTLKIEDAAQRAQIAAYENGMRPMGAFSVPQDLKPETMQEMRAQLNETYGGVDNAYKIALLAGGAKWEEMSFDLNEAGIIAARTLTREECAAAYDMPPPVIQILDRATFSNITEQHLMLYMDTMGPWMVNFEETLQVQLIKPEPAWADQFVEFDLNEVLKGDISKRMEALSKATWMTDNEKRQIDNLPFKEDKRADRLNGALANSSLMEAANAAGALVRAGYNPDDVADYVGLTGIRHSGRLPVTVREDEEEGTGRAAVREARCPTCGDLAGKNVEAAEFNCRRCKTPFEVRDGVLTTSIA